MSTGPATVDVLSDVLRTVRLTGAVFFPFEATSPWADEIPAATAFAPLILPGVQNVLSYHIVTTGTCWAALHGGPPVRLKTGDIVVIPHGDAYVISSEPGIRSTLAPDAVLAFFRAMATAGAPSIVIEGGRGAERAALVCGFLGCDVRPFNPLLHALPPLMHVKRPESASAHDRLEALIALALTESRENQPGAKSVLLRLSEILFIEVVRRYVETLPTGQTGWLAGLGDATVGHALSLLHERPADAWTLGRLARAVGRSRSALAARLTDHVGQPPMRYLSHWRIQLASRLLVNPSTKVAAVANEVGYGSEEAFSRAFKKIVGVPPAHWRDSDRPIVQQAG